MDISWEKLNGMWCLVSYFLCAKSVVVGCSKLPHQSHRVTVVYGGEGGGGGGGQQIYVSFIFTYTVPLIGCMYNMISSENFTLK